MGAPDLFTGDILKQNYGRLVGMITHTHDSIDLGVLRPYNWVYALHLYVTEAFNGTTPRITAGYSGTTNAYMTAIDVSGTGLKSPSLGAGAIYDPTGRQAVLYRTGSGATTGKAIFILEFFYAPKVN